jgi:mRNA-degrading endonuclease toxin of MazEF toxin-antitoxin module
MIIPLRGDILLLNNKEDNKEMFVFVLSDHVFNELGICLVCQIDIVGDSNKYLGFAVGVNFGSDKIQRHIMTNLVSTYDWSSGQWTLIENVSPLITRDSLARLAAIIEI